jgi:transcriptional regulator of acetoin/glycerol metabolism
MPQRAHGSGRTRRAAHEALDRRILLDALRDAGGNISAVAKALGLRRRSIHQKMRRLGIAPLRDDRVG